MIPLAASPSRIGEVNRNTIQPDANDNKKKKITVPTTNDEYFKREIKKVMFEVGEFSLIPGISNIVRSGNELSVKILWIVFQMVLLAIAVYLVTINSTNYLKYEVTTKIREISEFPSFFPTITICNLNYFTTNEAIQYLTNVGVQYGMANMFDYNVFLNSSANEYKALVEAYKSIGPASVLISNLNKSTIQQLGFAMKQVMNSCYFGGNQCNIEIDFEWFFHPNYGYAILRILLS
jgi:hypothetical protein